MFNECNEGTISQTKIIQRDLLRAEEILKILRPIIIVFIVEFFSYTNSEVPRLCSVRWPAYMEKFAYLKKDYSFLNSSINLSNPFKSS